MDDVRPRPKRTGGAWPSPGRKRVGLLGGSFNPAHSGHRHVAELALRRLRLNQVWLMVSPGNPLKPLGGMAPLSDRLASAERVADGRRIVATDLESQLRTRYTFDTLRALRRRFRCIRFVWLMGADIMAELPRWRRWETLVRVVPFAVLPRPTYTHAALGGRAARRLRAFRIPARAAATLADCRPPAWVFLPARESAASATALRRPKPQASRPEPQPHDTTAPKRGAAAAPGC